MSKTRASVFGLASSFPQARPLPGVTDNGDRMTRRVPTFGMKRPGPDRTGERR